VSQGRLNPDIKRFTSSTLSICQDESSFSEALRSLKTHQVHSLTIPSEPLLLSTGRFSEIIRGYRGALYGGVKLSVKDRIGNIDDTNLVSREGRNAWEDYLAVCEEILSLDGADPNLRCVSPSGSTAVFAMLKVASLYRTFKNGNNISQSLSDVVCSSGMHGSVEDLPWIRVTRVPIESGTRQMKPELLLSEIKRVKPAILILAIGRTADGVLETLPSEVESYCLENNILVGLDMTLASYIALSPDKPLNEGDETFKAKEAYRTICKSPAVKIVTAGIGKILGSYSGAATYVIHSANDADLIRAAEETFHKSYFLSQGNYGATSVSTESIAESVEEVKSLGLASLRALVTISFVQARFLEYLLKENGVEVLPVQTSVVPILLAKDRSAQEILETLESKYSIRMARIKPQEISGLDTIAGEEREGVRVVFRPGRVIPLNQIFYLAGVLTSVCKNIPPEETNYLAISDNRAWNNTFAHNFPREMVELIDGLYFESALPESTDLPASLDEKFEMCCNYLSAAECETGASTQFLHMALYLIHESRNDDLPLRRKYLKEAQYFAGIFGSSSQVAKENSNDNIASSQATFKLVAKSTEEFCSEAIRRRAAKNMPSYEEFLNAFLNLAKPTLDVWVNSFHPFPVIRQISYPLGRLNDTTQLIPRVVPGGPLYAARMGEKKGMFPTFYWNELDPS